jgi:hypothetical protein
MKQKSIAINKPCQENWEQMIPSERGRFCNLCSKNVIDFTTLNSIEITQIIKNTKGKICAKVTQQQLNTPLLFQNSNTEFKLPYSNFTSGVLIATALTFVTNTNAENNNISSEFILNQNSEDLNQKHTSESSVTQNETNTTQLIKGIIKDENGQYIENAKISLVTVDTMISTYSRNDGSFYLEIPENIIDNDNVIRITYYEIKNDKDNGFWGFENEDYVLTKKELLKVIEIQPKPHLLVVGNMVSYIKNRNPIVIKGGKEIKYSEFIKALNGEKSSCVLENKHYEYFGSKAAVAIYGLKAKDGLYIVTSNKL